MANENELLDQRIHDAFERVKLSEEAQQLMLTRLMVAQLRVEAEDEVSAAQGTKEEPETLLREGLAMASTVAPQDSAPAARRTGPRHATRISVPAIDEAQAVSSASSNEVETLPVTDAGASADEALQRTTVVSRRSRARHFKAERTRKLDAAQSAEVLSTNEPEASADMGNAGAASLQETTVIPRRVGPKHFKSSATTGLEKAQSAGDSTGVANGSKGGKSRGRSQKSAWQWMLPLAAVLALAVVVVQVSGVFKGPKDKATDTVVEESVKSVASESTNTDAAGAVEESEPLASVDAAAAPEVTATADEEAKEETEEAKQTERDPMSVDYYPLITMADGTSFTALREGLYVDEVDEARIGDLVGEATASSFDAPNESGMSCLVYELLDEEGGYAVQYDGEDTYWLCTSI